MQRHVSAWRNACMIDNPLVLLPLQDGIGTAGAVIYDASGRGRHGAVTPSGDLVANYPGPRGGTKAMLSDGVTTQRTLRIPYDAAWIEPQALTVEFWFRTSTDLGGSVGMVGRDTVGANRPWVVVMLATGGINAYSNNNTGPVKTTTRTGLDDQRWHHFAWGYEAAGGTGYHMVDGAIDNTYTGGGTLPSQADPLHVFFTGAAALAAFPGALAFLAFYGTKLTPSQVRSHYDVIARQAA